MVVEKFGHLFLLSEECKLYIVTIMSTLCCTI